MREEKPRERVHLDRVYISVFGSGLGHATRMLPVADNLAGSSVQVRFSSSDEVTRFLARTGFACNDMPLVDVVYTENGSFSAKETAKYSPLIFYRFLRQVNLETKNLIEFKPDVVLSDSVLATVIASRAVGKRVVSILNQLRLESSPRTPRIAAKLLTNGSITVGNEFWELSDKILLPDLPPPYTISERNLWGAGGAAKKAEYIGFLTPREDFSTDPLTEKLKREGGERTRTTIFWQISGPPPTRSTLLAKALKIASSYNGRAVFIISAGNPAGSTQPREIPGGYLYDWCPVKDSLVVLSDVVVSRAGHTSLAQFILHSKPSVLIPITSHSEQSGNAVKASKLGIAVDLSEDNLDISSFQLAISEIQNETFVRRVKEIGDLSRRYDALNTILLELRR